ncbi:MAG: right-handed parallel beta-helix repeat-containing protein [Oscillatoriaceae cyanobacterium Prado104]|jgi:hypothetical protein|nr:right-handed parallel beta-helix repeat-containing protein [Oscillatoriaceae cyanobacterium Prado104]
MQTLRFDNLGTFTVPSFTQSGVTISGSDTLRFFNSTGVGVTGGLSENVVDGNEFVTFRFEGGVASNVSYGLAFLSDSFRNGNGIIGEREIEAFDINGNSLGTIETSGGETNVSTLFGDRLISGFQIKSISGDLLRLDSVTFTTEFIVDTLIDENDGNLNTGDVSLREALLATQSGGTIRFSPTLSGGTIALALGELAIDKNITIEGLGENNLTISGSNESRIFRIGGNTEVNINGLTIADGFALEDGGAIDNRGILNLNNTIVRDSVASDDGGGIHNLGTLRLNNSLLSNNIAEDDGGGIGNFNGIVEAANTLFSGNTAEDNGGGIFNSNGTIRLVSSTLTENAVDGGNGGGIRSFRGTTSVKNTIIAGNIDVGGESPDANGNFTSNGFNLIGISEGSTGFGNNDIVGTVNNPIDPQLSDLENHHAPQIGSPVIDAGDPSLTGSDFLGNSRLSGTRVDIGAVEFQFVDRLTVDTAIDEFDGDLTPGDVSLREAIFAINAGGTIDFAASLSGSAIGLTLGTLNLNKNLIIQGLGADNLTLNGNNSTRILSIEPNANVEIRGLTFANGSNTAIFNFGTINLSDSIIRDSRGRFTGGINNQGNLTLVNSIIRNNQDEEREGGSGIVNVGTATLQGSTVSNNLNGGIFNTSSGNLTIDNSTISNHLDRSGIRNSGNLTVTDSTISNNNAAGNGGGINNAGTLSLNNSTISGNSADFGGGIFNDSGATFTITHSTIANNTGRSPGGGIFSVGLIGETPVITPQIGNSIVAGNISAANSDVDGRFSSNGFNLIGNGNGSLNFTNGVNGDIVGTLNNPIDPRLSPLQDNGGSTLTHVPLPGSLAIDNGNPNATELDQRGVDRPQGLGVDIGAVEAEFTFAESLRVDTLADELDGVITPGNVSLREAIFFTNSDGIIDFDPSLNGGTIRLNLGELEIQKNLTIRGLGANNLTISGNQTSRIFNVDDGNSENAIAFSIDGITLTEGAATDNGGAIYNSENLTVNNSIITLNSANSGGGIFNLGTATIGNSTIDSNSADSQGGGILNQGNLQIDRATILGNFALADGGGINNDGGTLTVTNSTINSNFGQTASGGIDNDRGTATIINSTISDNLAESYGGIATNLGNTAILNSTITANISNSGGNGVFNGTDSNTVITNSIVAGNWNNSDIFALNPFTSGGNNLIGNGAGIAGFTDGVSGDIVGTVESPIDPQLGTLQDNGGATFTHALLSGSPAINAGNNATLPADTRDFDGDGNTSEPLPADQRGVNRIQNGFADIGAFESDIETRPLVSLQLTDAFADETGDVGIYTLTRNQTDGELTVNLNLDEFDTATFGDDYTLEVNGIPVTPNNRNFSLTFTDGESELNLRLVPIDDFLPEIPETVSVTLNESIEYVRDAANGGGTVTIAFSDLTTVTNTNDSGIGSLRQAIFYANANPGADTITFAGSVFTDNNPDTITLTTGELRITDSLTVQGLGANRLTVSGNNASRVFNIDNGNASQINVSINGLTIAGANTTGLGGGILNRENLTVSNSTLRNNVAGEGGGINNDGGTLTLSDSTLNNNRATTFSGGIDSDRGIATITNSTISGNSAANFGGIATNLGNTTITNSTITNNQGNGNGNGLFNGGAGSTVTVRNTLVAGNQNNRDLSGNFISGGNNLIGSSNGGSGFNNGKNGDKVGTAANPLNPLLSPLQNFSGTTQTHALLLGSPAIDAGNNANAPATDQRGIVRPQDGDNNGTAVVDIGAFEEVIATANPIVVLPNSDNNPTNGSTNNKTFNNSAPVTSSPLSLVRVSDAPTFSPASETAKVDTSVEDSGVISSDNQPVEVTTTDSLTDNNEQPVEVTTADSSIDNNQQPAAAITIDSSIDNNQQPATAKTVDSSIDNNEQPAAAKTFDSSIDNNEKPAEATTNDSSIDNNQQPAAEITADSSIDNNLQPAAAKTVDSSIDNDRQPTTGETTDSLIGNDRQPIEMETPDILTDGGRTNEFVYTSLMDAGDIITNFQVGLDKLVFGELLDTLNYTGSNAIADEYIRLVSGGTGTILEIDPDGPIGSGIFRPFLLIENVKPEALNQVNNFVF